MIIDPNCMLHDNPPTSPREIDRCWFGIDFGNSFIRVSGSSESHHVIMEENTIYLMETNMTRYELFGEESDGVDFTLINIKKLIDCWYYNDESSSLKNDCNLIHRINMLENDENGRLTTQIFTEKGIQMQYKDVEKYNKLVILKIIDTETNQQVQIPLFTVLVKLFEKLRGKLLSSSQTQNDENLFNCNVITIPVYYGDWQIAFVKDAAEIAGFKVKRMIKKPISAGIAYGFDAKPDRELLVMNCGSEKTIVTLYNVEDYIFDLVDYISDDNISGNSIDEILADYCTQEFKKRMGKQVNERARDRLRVACKKAKEDLFGENAPLNVLIRVDSLVDGVDFSMAISKPKFEQLVSPLLSKITTLITELLKKNSRTVHNVNDIVLSGGMCHISKIATIIRECFKDNHQFFIHDSIPPKTINVRGAALYCDKFRSRNSFWFGIVTLPLSIGLEQDGKMMILAQRNYSLPCNKSFTVKKKVNLITNQFKFRLYMGERAQLENNLFLREFNIPNIWNVESQQFNLNFIILQNESIFLSIQDTLSINEFHFQMNRREISQEFIEEMVRLGNMDKSS